jgi:hypothetical protein
LDTRIHGMASGKLGRLRLIFNQRRDGAAAIRSAGHVQPAHRRVTAPGIQTGPKLFRADPAAALRV